MSRTIVQEYGPIYGEPVNGTVLGRPNGSVFVPITNTIKISMKGGEDYHFFRYSGGGTDSLIVCDEDGTASPDTTGPAVYVAVATSQDLSSYIQIQLYSDGELTDLVSSRDVTAGTFNFEARLIDCYDSHLSDGDALYFRAQLINNGTPVATSDVIECKMVVQ